MCGITGFNWGDQALISKMNSSIRHRGPDAEGQFVDASISIGHVLLSIRGDTQKSRQPFTQVESEWVLAFNGQIYNTIELKKKFLGSEFQHEDLDTALLFALIEKYRWDFISKIRGMFAIALYNKKEQRLRLYRDSSGQKCLYYYLKDNRFIFSSEIKGILAALDSPREVDTTGLMAALAFGYQAGPLTLFKNIRKLTAGECLDFNLKDNFISTQPIIANQSDYYEGLDDMSAFRMLVSEHLQSKHPVSINLSGGLDSTILLHFMKDAGYRVKTYSTSFDIQGGNYNEDAQLARRLAKDYNTEHHELRITKDSFLRSFKEAYLSVEEPNYNNSLPTYYLLAKAEGINGDKNRVVFSGDGGDEVFGGYMPIALNFKYDRYYRWFGRFLTNSALHLVNRGSSFDLSDWTERYLRSKTFPKSPSVNFATSREDLITYTKAFTEKYIEKFSVKKSSILHWMLLDRCVWQANENFTRNDKIFMSQSLEVRAPLSYEPFRTFYDRKLDANRDYLTKNVNKIYLRKVFENQLPSYITQRRSKTGWTAPVKVWYDEGFRDLFVSILESTSSNCGGSLINWKAIADSLKTQTSWPGKDIILYLSLAMLADQYKLEM